MERLIEAKAEDEIAVDEQEILVVKELVTTLLKTIHATRIYPATNPMPQSFLDVLCQQFDDILSRLGTISLQVTDDAFLYQHTSVYEDEDLRTSLAFLLFKDGLRELTFHQGLTRDEIKRLVTLFGSSDNMNRLEDDYVILLWEMDFQSISFDATDSSLEEVMASGEELAADEPLLAIVEREQQFEASLELADDLGHQHDHDDAMEMAQEGWSLPPSEVITLSPVEQQRLSQDVWRTIHEPCELAVIDILFELLLFEEQMTVCNDIAGVLVKIVDARLAEHDLESPRAILQRLHDLQAACSGEKLALVQGVLDALGDASHIEQLGRLLIQAPELDPVIGYLRMLRINAVVPLLHLLGELTSTNARKLLCEVLAEIGKDAQELFFPFLSDPRWYLVRNIVHILGLMGSECAVPGLLQASRHADVRVRREAFQALCAIGSTQAVSRYEQALSDEDAFIRGIAAVALGQVGGDEGLKCLTGEIQSRKFHAKELTEILSFYQGIGATRSTQAVSFLRHQLFKVPWFRKQHAQDDHAGAALALGMIGTPDALEILRTGAQSRHASIRTACQRALRDATMERR